MQNGKNANNGDVVNSASIPKEDDEKITLLN